jgi:hypothetical protein
MKVELRSEGWNKHSVSEWTRIVELLMLTEQGDGEAQLNIGASGKTVSWDPVTPRKVKLSPDESMEAESTGSSYSMVDPFSGLAAEDLLNGVQDPLKALTKGWQPLVEHVRGLGEIVTVVDTKVSSLRASMGSMPKDSENLPSPQIWPCMDSLISSHANLKGVLTSDLEDSKTQRSQDLKAAEDANAALTAELLAVQREQQVTKDLLAEMCKALKAMDLRNSSGPDVKSGMGSDDADYMLGELSTLRDQVRG